MAKGKRKNKQNKSKRRQGSRMPRKIQVVQAPPNRSIRHDTGRPVTVEWVYRNPVDTVGVVHTFSVSRQNLLQHVVRRNRVINPASQDTPIISSVSTGLYQGFKLHQILSASGCSGGPGSG